MLTLLAIATPAHALSCAGRNADTCDAVNALMPIVNAEVGFTLLSDTASSGRFRSSTIYNELERIRVAANSHGCRVDGSFEGWTGGVYGQTTWSGDYGEHGGQTGSSNGTVHRAERGYAGVWSGPGGSGGDIGDLFSGYHASGAFGSNRGTGWVMGRWIRRSGPNGVFVGLHGSCDTNVDVPDAFETWYPGTFQIFGSPPTAVPDSPSVATLALVAPRGASDLVFDDEGRMWIPTIISGTDSVWGVDAGGLVTVLSGVSNYDMGAIAIDPTTGNVHVSYTTDSGTAFLGVESAGVIPVEGTGLSFYTAPWANIYLRKSGSSIAVDASGCTWFPNFTGLGNLDCLTLAGGFQATTVAAFAPLAVESVALDPSGVAYATTASTIWRVAGPGDVTVAHVAPAHILDIVFAANGDLYYETVGDEIRRVASGAGSSTSFASVSGDGKLAIAPNGTLYRGQLDPEGFASWQSFVLP